jgi:hypothetical protein
VSGGGFTLVVLAAGLGSRFGGLKQLEPVGPGGATLMDYSVFDAQRTGCDDVVFIIRPEMEAAFKRFASARYGDQVRVRTAHQLQAEGRAKPWGTGHAVLSVAPLVNGPFVVVNADDFYGAPAYDAAAGFARGAAGGVPPAWAVVGYRLQDTTSAAGGVNRAICRVTGGWLVGMEEVLGIVATDAGKFTGRGAGAPVTVPGDVLVSMNMWVFTPEVCDELREGFARFRAEPSAATSEYLLPTAIENAVREGRARVRVLDPGSHWFGMTYPADRPAVSAALDALVRDGRYPEHLR